VGSASSAFLLQNHPVYFLAWAIETKADQFGFIRFSCLVLGAHIFIVVVAGVISGTTAR